MFKVNRLPRVFWLAAWIWLGLTSLTQAAPKYVFFFIGDGMGPEQIRAGGMYANGSEGTLSFESFSYQGYLTTYSANSSVTDSAAAGTALATGFKVNNGVISMAYPGDGSELKTLLERSQVDNKRVGIVTTSYMVDATPAAFGAHEPLRASYANIANDFLTQTRPNILFGGTSYIGGIYYMSGAAAAGYTVVTDWASMNALDTNVVSQVSGQFGNTQYMPYEYDGMGALPQLSEMTAVAIDILDNDPDGFFLMVEGGLIDVACHANDLHRAVPEVVEFSHAVQAAIDWVEARNETDFLILVAADHETGGLTVIANNGAGSYPTVSWSTTNHTATNVRVFAWGVNEEMVSGVMNNTDMWEVVTAETKATNPNPVHGAAQVAVNTVLSWTAGTKAVTHDLYFGLTPTPPFVQNQSETTFVPVLEPGTVYYWRIDEVNPLESGSPWVGDVWTFTTASVPGQASNPNPVNGATNVAVNAQLNWIAGSDTTSHDIYFGTTNPPQFQNNQPGTTFNPGILSYGVTYYWQIDEIGPGGVTAGSIWSFTTETSTNAFAQADLPVSGTVGGSYLDTHTSNDIYETITEKKSGGAPNTRYSLLEHQWTFNINSGNSVTFYLEAHKTASTDGDNFVFSYSTNGTNYTPMATVNSTSDSLYSYILPPSTNGVVYIRVTDTDHVAGNLALDTISIDQMYIRIEAGGTPDTTAPDPNPLTWAEVPYATSSTSISMTATTAIDPSGVLYYFACITGGGHSSGWQDSPIYEDGGLLPGTQYSYQVQARDKSMNQNATVFSVIASATTNPQGIPGQAMDPNPLDEATANRKTVILSWSVGTDAASHDVYLGTNPNLTSADFKGNQTVATYDPPVLVRNITYYWRIDEVNASGKTAGEVWSFLAQ